MAYVERTNGEVIHALGVWEKTHPWPNDPCLAVGEKDWAPAEFMDAIQRDGLFAQKLLEFIFAQARRLKEDPLDYVARMIRESVAITEEDPV